MESRNSGQFYTVPYPLAIVQLMKHTGQSMLWSECGLAADTAGDVLRELDSTGTFVGRCPSQRCIAERQVAEKPSCKSLSKSSTSACMIPSLKQVDGSDRSCRVTPTTTRYQGTWRAYPCSGTGCWAYGGEPFAAGASSAHSRGLVRLRWVDDGITRKTPFIE